MSTLSWHLLQIADSAFPVGGFAHSGGLESVAQNGALSQSDSIEAHIADVAWQCGRGFLPFVTAAHADADRFLEFDARMETVLVNHVASRASRSQGRAWLATSVRVFPCAALATLDRCTRDARAPRHLAPVFGAVARAMGTSGEDARRIFLYLAARGALSAAVRLGLIGPLEAQRLQGGSTALFDRVLAACGALDLDDVAQTAPMLDLFQGTHDRLYCRLFQT